MVKNQHLFRAIQLAGNQTKLAKVLELYSGKRVAQSQVHDWLYGKIKRGIPAEYCKIIEQITNGLVRAEDLRPDVFRPLIVSMPMAEMEKNLKQERAGV